MNLRPLFSVVLLGIAPLSQSAAPPEGAAADGRFTRFEEDETGARLQTGVGSYRNKDGVTVDLIGAIHIGDKAYYERLNRRFTRYDAVLYEMVGGSYQRRMQWRGARARLEAAGKPEAGAEPAGPKSAGSLVSRIEAVGKYMDGRTAEEDLKLVREADREQAAGGSLAWLHPLYQTIEKSLGLTGQMSGIDYSRMNFVHADMTLAEFAAMQKEKSENLLTLWWKSVVVQVASPQAAPEQPGLLEIMESLCRHDGSVGLRRIAARTFGSLEGVLAGLESEEGTVILTGRNKVALGVLEQQIKLGKKSLAIFYGAAHLADMEKRLLSAGFVRSGGEWFNAWEIPPEGAGAKRR